MTLKNGVTGDGEEEEVDEDEEEIDEEEDEDEDEDEDEMTEEEEEEEMYEEEVMDEEEEDLMDQDLTTLIDWKVRSRELAALCVSALPPHNRLPYTCMLFLARSSSSEEQATAAANIDTRSFGYRPTQ